MPVPIRKPESLILASVFGVSSTIPSGMVPSSREKPLGAVTAGTPGLFALASAQAFPTPEQGVIPAVDNCTATPPQ